MKTVWRKSIFAILVFAFLFTAFQAGAFGLWTDKLVTFGSPTEVTITTYFLQSSNSQSSGYYYDQNGDLQFSAEGFHHGIDIAGGGRVDKNRVVISDTEPIRAALDGEVVFAGFLPNGYGDQVIMYNGFNLNGNGQYTYTFYSHMGTVDGTSFVGVSEGELLPAGWQIGRQGNSGLTAGRTGIHVDFEIRLSPVPIIDWTTTGRNDLIAASPNFYLKKNLTFTDDKKVRRIKPGPWPQIPSENVVDWPMFMHDLGHSGVATSVLIPPLTKIWETAINPDSASTPIVFDGKIYIGSSSNKLVVLDTITGQTIWEFTTTGQIASSATVADNTVFITSRDGKLYALDKDNGTLKWEIDIGSSIISSPILFGNLIYFIAGDEDKVYAAQASDGEIKWSKRVSGIWGTISVGNDLIYAGASGKIIAFNSQTGRTIWTFDFSDEARGAGDIVFSDSTLYFDAGCISTEPNVFDCRTSRIYALSAENGERKWTFSVTSNNFSLLAVSNNNIYFGATIWISPTNLDGKLYKLDKITGQMIWEVSNPTPLGTPIVSGSILYVGVGGISPLYTGSLKALDTITGSLLWETTVGVHTHNNIPTIADEKLFIGVSGNGIMYAFGI